MNKRRIMALGCALLTLALLGCGGARQPDQRPGVVYLDPNAAPAAATAAPGPLLTQATADPAPATADRPGAEDGPDLYFECRGVRLAPMMEAAPVLAALGEPIHTFEADSCAYLGKDLFYAYPGVELTVNQVEGVARITAIQVVDDLVETPQGLRINDPEQKVLSLLGEREISDVYTCQRGGTVLMIQVKEAEDGTRRIWSLEYRPAEEP